MVSGKYEPINVLHYMFIEIWYLIGCSKLLVFFWASNFWICFSSLASSVVQKASCFPQGVFGVIVDIVMEDSWALNGKDCPKPKTLQPSGFTVAWVAPSMFGTVAKQPFFTYLLNDKLKQSLNTPCSSSAVAFYSSRRRPKSFYPGWFCETADLQRLPVVWKVSSLSYVL